VYVARATAYRVPLHLLGYSVRRRFLWATALVASALHQVVPTAGASGYAFLTYALGRRGVSAGQAPLVALIDTLSYDAAMATVVVVSLVYLATTAAVPVAPLLGLAVPGLALVAVAAGAWWIQRDERRFVPLVLRWKDRAAALAGRRWPDEPVRRFLAQFTEGKRVIARHPWAFARMVGLQYLTVGCDVAALYLVFVALGHRPAPGIVVMGLVLAMAGVLAIAAPGGGGGFEVIMATFFSMHGMPSGEAVAATVLYRAVAFWLPVLASVPALLGLRQRGRDVRRRRRSLTRRGDAA
jgi:uncharacterized protein (TIRG00374 family)